MIHGQSKKCLFSIVLQQLYLGIVTTIPTIISTQTTISTIIQCDGEAACGSHWLLTALCYRPGGVMLETSFEHWVSHLTHDHRCLPCCILEEGIHRQIKTCSSMSSAWDVRNQLMMYGRCGIDFYP